MGAFCVPCEKFTKSPYAMGGVIEINTGIKVLYHDIGYFLKPRELLKMERIESRGIELARRPTGGGIVFHLWDFAFSVLVPARSSLYSQNTLHNYALINRAVLAAVKQFLQGSVLPELALQKLSSSCSGFCMARPTKYDVVVAGKKVAGAAQRKTKGGFLHQGTIALTLPDFELLEELRRVIQVGLGGMAAFRLGRIPFLLRAEAQLHRRVTVVVRVLHLHDRTRTGLHHRDGHGSTVITEDLGHTQLLS